MRSAVVLEPNITGLFLIVPSEFDADDLKNLSKAVATDPSGVTEHDILQEAQAGRVQLWRLIAPDARAIVVTRVNQLFHGKKPELVIWLIAGNGVLRHAKNLVNRLYDFAKGQGCGTMRSHSIRPIAYWLEKAAGFKPKFTVMIREIE